MRGLIVRSTSERAMYFVFFKHIQYGFYVRGAILNLLYTKIVSLKNQVDIANFVKSVIHQLIIVRKISFVLLKQY